jgi:peptidoglycan/LPS O-acetylase OafA/YrhL
MNKLYLSSWEMSARPGYIPSLDGLRAISISVVLLAHFIDGRIFPGGLGVYIFFVISGFLITRLLLSEHKRTGTISLRLFYTRRILRLYPVIVVFTTVVIGLDIVLRRSYNMLEPASALGYFANYLYAYFEVNNIHPEMPFGIFWSLSLEEHFYFLYPLVFLLMKGDPRRLFFLIVAVCLGCLVLRISMAMIRPEFLKSDVFYLLSQYRIDSIGFGVLLALGCETAEGQAVVGRLAGPVTIVLAGIGILICLSIRDPFFRQTWRYTFFGMSISAGLAGVLFSEACRPVQVLLNSTIPRWLGRLSYSIYVWHEGVQSFLPMSHLPTWQRTLISIVAALSVAILSYYTVERPFLSLRTNLLRERRVNSELQPLVSRVSP